MSVFKCAITYKKIEGNSHESTKNKLLAHGFIDKYYNVKTDVATWRKGRSELNELASARLGRTVNLFEEKKLLNGIRAVPDMKLFGMLDQMNKEGINALSQEELQNIDRIFKKYPQLATLFNNNKNLYGQYFKSIFPNSIVNGELFFHGTPSDIDKFKITEKSVGGGLWFTGDVGKAKRGGGGNNTGNVKNVYGVVLDIRHPKYKDSDGRPLTINPDKYLQDSNGGKHDAAIFEPTAPKNLLDLDSERITMKRNQVVVFNENQVHIIGDSNDLELARKFLNNSSQFVRDEIGIDELGDSDTNIIEPVSTLPIEKRIYSELGIKNGSVISNEKKETVQQKIDEFNELNTNKKLSLVSVGNGFLINTEFSNTYLYTPTPMEKVEDEVRTDSMNNFSLPCIKD